MVAVRQDQQVRNVSKGSQEQTVDHGKGKAQHVTVHLPDSSIRLQWQASQLLSSLHPDR